MEKLKRQQEAIERFLTEQARVKPFNVAELENQIIIDRQHNHFQLLSMGWVEGKHSFKVLFHFDIKDGKVWIQRNETEEQVADRLMELGIDRQDIVLGFLPAYARPYSGFAAA